MDNEILQQFLDSSLLDLGEEPEKLDRVKKAAGDLTQSLRSDRRALLRSASLLLNERLVEEPIVALCEGAIKTHWQTYRSRFAADTNQLFRAVLLQAIAQVTEDADCSYAAIVLYTASSPLQYIVTD